MTHIKIIIDDAEAADITTQKAGPAPETATRPKRALITGVTGQDGSYLAELLLDKGYQVFGLVRRTTRPDFGNAQHIKEKIGIIFGDLTDMGSLVRAIEISQPDEVYNLAAQSFVGGSWAYPVATAEMTGLGALRLLETLRLYRPTAKFYQASSSEMFGNQDGALDESTPLKPRSPYGFSKVFAHQATVNYRESFGMFACAGILFNHESPRRGGEFVTQKIVRGAVAIAKGEAKELALGNLEARRDWGHARDYVQAMWLMLQAETPADYVIATGKNHSIKDFLDITFKELGLDWHDYVREDPAFYRPAELNSLVGNAGLAKKKLGWQPTSTLEMMITEMIRVAKGGEA